jgi:hypothetical protein
MEQIVNAAQKPEWKKFTKQNQYIVRNNIRMHSITTTYKPRSK